MADTNEKVEKTNEMDEFLSRLPNLDNKKKLLTGDEILEYIKNKSNPLTCSDLNSFIKEIILFLKSYSPRVNEIGMKILNCFLERLGIEFRPYFSDVLPYVFENLSNSKEFLRKENRIFLKKLWSKELVFPNGLIEKLLPYFDHKNNITRHEVLKVVLALLKEFGAARINSSPLITPLIILLNDAYPEIREVATVILSKFYNVLGKKLRSDMQKKYAGHPSKLDVIFKVFDEIDATEANIKVTASTIAPAPEFLSKIDGQDKLDTVEVNLVPFQALKLGLSKDMESKVLKHEDDISRLRSKLAKLKHKLDVAEKILFSELDLKLINEKIIEEIIAADKRDKENTVGNRPVEKNTVGDKSVREYYKR